MRLKIFYVIVAISLLSTEFSPSYAQCAMCKSTVESNQNIQGNARAAGLNAGILYLMAVPYLLFGTLAFFWYRNSKIEKNKREKIAARVRKALHEN